jgi:glutathione synthase/RimK-type ligase-like ATP-grasp enzyme
MVERSAADGFRANVSLGASIRLVEPTEHERAFVMRIVGLVGPGYYGVDIVTGPTGSVLMEIEDVVGSRSLYRLGVHDHAVAVLRWVQDALVE